MDKRHTALEDKEITRIYDKAYSPTEERAKDSELAEKMLAASAIYDQEENWSTLTKVGSEKRPAHYQRKKCKIL